MRLVIYAASFVHSFSLSLSAILSNLRENLPFFIPIVDLALMEREIGADEPLNHHDSSFHEEDFMDSEKAEELAGYDRKSKLLAITWHKRCHQLDKLMGLTTSDTPLSVIPESILEDSEMPDPLADELAPDCSNSSVLEVPLAIEADLEVPLAIEAGEKETLDPDLGFPLMGEAPGFSDRAKAYDEELRLLTLEYDETKEFEPFVEFMMRSLLPRYFELVRSFHLSWSVIV